MVYMNQLDFSVRSNWTIEEIEWIYSLPLFELVAKAHECHLRYHKLGEVQVCKLVSIKTGGCSEDCAYCPQSASYQTGVAPKPLMTVDEVLEEVRDAVHLGASRVCLGAAWREVRDGKQFNTILEMVREVRSLGIEVCCTLGMVNKEQMERLHSAGLYAYNHNLDTSESHYKNIITTRTYQERIDTIDRVQDVGLSVCSGGIFGIGEKHEDRMQFLHTLSKRNPHPQSVPLNRLTPIKGTPLENAEPVPFWEFLRLIALFRIVLPQSILRLSCERNKMSTEQQALAFFAGANSIFCGEKMLTTPNVSPQSDEQLFSILQLKKRKAFVEN